LKSGYMPRVNHLDQSREQAYNASVLKLKERRAGQMDDATQKVLSDIQTKIKTHLDEVAKLKSAANMLADLAGQGPIYADIEQESKAVGPTRADAYYGKPLARAVREYLDFRQQAVPVEDIQRGLEQGGFDFNALGWSESGRLRALAMSIAKNTTVFHRLPNGMWGLNAWYPEAKQRKKGKSRSRDEEPEHEEVPEQKAKGSAADTTEPKLLTE
jgi:hypothetical protein